MDSERSQKPARIVVGVDGSEQSQLALRWAAQLAPCLDCRIEAVIAWLYPSIYGFAIPNGWDPGHDAQTSLEDAVDAAFDGARPKGLQLLVRQGLPAKVLLDAGVGARMLIVGSRGHGGFAGLLLGSVSSVVAEHAHCPVLVVHPASTPDLTA
ncbi:MAG: universal stress protein [Terracoccus sp.]